MNTFDTGLQVSRTIRLNETKSEKYNEKQIETWKDWIVLLGNFLESAARLYTCSGVFTQQTATKRREKGNFV